MNTNTLIIAGSIVLASVMIAGAIIFALGGSGGSVANTAVEGQPSAPAAPTYNRATWNQSEAHRYFAEQIGLDVDAHIACFEERRYQARVQQSTQEAVANGARGTPHSFVNTQPLSGAQPYQVFEQQIEAALAGELEIDPAITHELEGFPSLGDENAPVLLVEYSDYACPFCKRLAEDAIRQIKSKYVDSGQVRIVYKDFAVVGGERAAEAAHCAGEQGKYWEYHDILFANQ
jgi:protein-disulfide isomerase